MPTHEASEKQPLFENLLPTYDAAQGIYDEQDFQRAVEAYRFFYPTVAVEGAFHGIRGLGISDGGAMIVLTATPRHLMFTANSDMPFCFGVVDLQSGPFVIDLPVGTYMGQFIDHHQHWIGSLGLVGPNVEGGGKYLLLPPGFTGDAPTDCYVMRSATYKVLIAICSPPLEHGMGGAMAELRKVKVYPFAKPRAVLPFVDVNNRSLDATPLRWENGIEYWRRLHAVITGEPALDEFRAMYGELAALGIEAGKDFSPDLRMQRILTQAAKVGLQQLRVETFASRRAERLVWPDRHWEWVSMSHDDPNFETRDYIDLHARDRWFFQALGTFGRNQQADRVTFIAARDQSGAYLDGGETYKLSIPQPVPAALFWSVTVYDAKTRSQVQTRQNKAVFGSLDHDESFVDEEGRLELYFGPTAPEGPEQRWIQTNPGSGYFLYFRIYGPEPESTNGEWRLGDLLRTDLANSSRPDSNKSRRTRHSISRSDIVDSRIGRLRVTDGIPTEETMARVYETLDHMHAVEAFLNSYQATSLGALRKGLRDSGVHDNDVLLFSRLMDSHSQFLTADCDTVSFFSCLDLRDGPVVIEVPSRVLGALDDMWCRWVSDFGMLGPDRGEGGKYLVVPQHCRSELPEADYFVCSAATDHVFLSGRAFLENDDPTHPSARIRSELRIYRYAPESQETSVAPCSEPTAPPPTRFVEGTGRDMSTIPPNDASYYELLDAVVQSEPAEALPPELAGQFAAIGIRKGQRFAPDARMRRILGDAVALANATARTFGMRAREGEGFRFHEGTSAWLNPLFVSGFEFLRPPPAVERQGLEPFACAGSRTQHARTSLFYMATGITPTMRTHVMGFRSQYMAAMWDANGAPFEGHRSYQLTLPPKVPVALFWSLTLYDNQTRSMLRTTQRFPRVGSQAYPTPAVLRNSDGSIDIHIGPQQPRGVAASNWIQTDPRKGWFAILRLYSPLRTFFDKTWRAGEFVEVKNHSEVG